MVHVVVTRPWASEPALSSERRAIATTSVRSVLARHATPRPHAQIRLTDPSSALYRPAYREELYKIARALGSSDVAGTEPLRR